MTSHSPDQTQSTMLHINNLHKSFGDLAVLKGVNLEVAQQEVLVIIGPSGSGKSTLLRCCLLYTSPSPRDHG